MLETLYSMAAVRTAAKACEWAVEGLNKEE